MFPVRCCSFFTLPSFSHSQHDASRFFEQDDRILFEKNAKRIYIIVFGFLSLMIVGRRFHLSGGDMRLNAEYPELSV